MASRAPPPAISDSLSLLAIIPCKRETCNESTSAWAAIASAAHVAANLQLRNTEGAITVAEFELHSRQIVIDDLEALRGSASDKFPGAVGFVRVSLPGYAHDGRIGLVAVTDALSNHPSGRVFALVSSGGVWRVQGSDGGAGE
jgi:hypothetical protein